MNSNVPSLNKGFGMKIKINSYVGKDNYLWANLKTRDKKELLNNNPLTF